MTPFSWDTIYPIEDVYEAVLEVLAEGSPDLARACLTSPYIEVWLEGSCPLSTGFCSAASQALYFLSGGREEGVSAHYIRLPDGGSHWWVEKDDVVYDPTADQFTFDVPYEEGRGCGFQGRYVGGWQQPTKAAQPFVRAVERLLIGIPAAYRKWKARR